MADRIVLNTPLYKGEYELDIKEQPFSNLEVRWIKKISGYLPLTIQEGFAGADQDLFIALAVIALARAGKIPKSAALTVAATFDDLAAYGGDGGPAITFIGETPEPTPEEDEGDPPAEPATPPETEQPSSSTGPSSRPTLAPPASTLGRIGARA